MICLQASGPNLRVVTAATRLLHQVYILCVSVVVFVRLRDSTACLFVSLSSYLCDLVRLSVCKFIHLHVRVCAWTMAVCVCVLVFTSLLQGPLKYFYECTLL